MATYHYILNGQQHGPIDQTELDALAAVGSISPDDLVWTEGMADWGTYSEMFGAARYPELNRLKAISKGVYGILAGVGLLMLIGVALLLFTSQSKHHPNQESSAKAPASSKQTSLMEVNNKNEVLKVLRDGLKRHVVDEMRSKNQLLDKVGWAALVAPRQLTNQRQLTSASAALTNFVAASSRYVEQVRRAPIEFRKELRKSGLSATDQTVAADAFERLIKRDLPIFAEMEKADQDSAEIFFQMINHYREKWGKWYSYRTSVRFRDGELERQYVQFLKESKTIVNRDIALKDKLINITSRGVAMEAAKLKATEDAEISRLDRNAERFEAGVKDG